MVFNGGRAVSTVIGQRTCVSIVVCIVMNGSEWVVVGYKVSFMSRFKPYFLTLMPSHETGDCVLYFHKSPCAVFCACYCYSPSFLYLSLQVGRSSESAIDFVILDTIPADKKVTYKVPRITVSRFACRIMCDRSSPHAARVFAGGFNSSRNMFLGVSATSCRVWCRVTVLINL